MKTYSIAEINDLDHGIPISRFEGRIKKVFEQKQGEGQYGIWYLQNLIVEDGQQEITVTWTGDDPFDTGVEGQVYSFETGYDKKDKPVGIVRDIRSKNGKKYEGVKVDNRSKIMKLGAGDESTQRWDESQPKPKPKNGFQTARATMQQGDLNDEIRDKGEHFHDGQGVTVTNQVTNAPQSPPARSNGGDGVSEARKHLCQVANLYALCVRCANSHMIADEIPEAHKTNEQFQSTLASIWIEASGRRSTNGVDWWSYIDLMPDKPLPVNGGKHATTVKPIQEKGNACTCENTDGDNPLCPIHST